MSEPKVLVTTFEPDDDVDALAIYVDGKKVAQMEGYELVISAGKVIADILEALNVDVIVEQKYITLPEDADEYSFPERMS